MKTNYEIRYAAHPEDAKSYDTARIRRDFLIEKIFVSNEVNMVYSMYDRMVVGGALPVGEVLTLEAIDPLKAPFFLTRREMGIYNVGGPGVVKAGDAVFELGYKEALYLGSGDREVTFASKDAGNPAKFYFNSLTAHRNYPDKKVTKADAVVAHMGSLEGSNDRNINKMLVNQVLPTCQLQMGMTELLPAVTPAMAASSVPLMGPMMQQCTSAVIDGAANCLLAIRAGVVTRSAFRFAALGREEARQQACVREAGTMLAEISRETVGAIVEAFRKQLVNLPASMGQKISETVGTVADSALEKTRGAAQSVARGGTAVVGAVSSGTGAVIGAGQAVAGAVSSGAGAVADALGNGTSAVLGAVRGILPGNRRREATADERFALHLALLWSQGRPGWKRRRQLARLCDAEGVSAGLRTLVDRHPDLGLLEPQLSFWRGRAEDVLACGRSLELERGAAAVAWLAELDHRLELGGRLQGGHGAPASGWKRFWK